MDTRDRNPGTGGSAKQESTPVKEQVQQGASQVKEQVQQGAASLKDTVTQQATGQLEGQKEAATGGLQNVARAFRQTSDQLRDQDQETVARYLDRATAQVEQFSAYLGRRDLQQMARDAEQFARREPALFLGGAIALGLFASRFFKSSQAASTQGTNAPGKGQQRSDWRGQADWYGQDRPATAPAMSAPTPSAPPPAPRPSTAAGAGMGATGAKGIAGTSATGDVIVGGPPLPSDVIVGGPPREPGEGTRR